MQATIGSWHQSRKLGTFRFAGFNSLAFRSEPALLSGSLGGIRFVPFPGVPDSFPINKWNE